MGSGYQHASHKDLDSYKLIVISYKLNPKFGFECPGNQRENREIAGPYSPNRPKTEYLKNSSLKETEPF